MAKITHITELPRPRRLTLGQRTQREIALRIRELESRERPRVYDLAEIARLRELLQSTGDRDA
jgi:hypothetical protein